MKEKTTLPRSAPSLQTAYRNCERRGRFKEVDQTAYADYLLHAQKDLASAESDLQRGDFHWSRIKAYQSLFHLLNALLAKHFGYFSKDHGCIIVALMAEEIITSEIAVHLHLLTDKALYNAAQANIYEDIDEFRMQRNFALYQPKAWEEIKKEDVSQEINKIKENFKILAGLL